jgi:2-isopropylmalate synthase
VNINTPVEFIGYKYTQNGHYETLVSIRMNNEEHEFSGVGNGRLDAISNALQTQLGIDYTDLVYKQHALEIGSSSNAVSYVGITAKNGTVYWGCGIDTDIMTSSVKALLSAVNNMVSSLQLPVKKEFTHSKK